MNVRIDFSRCPAQSRSFQAFRPGNRVCNAWGRGAGKSWFARVVMWLLVAKWEHQLRYNEELRKSYRGVRIAFVMPTLAQFKRIGHAQAFVEDLSPSGEWGFLGAQINRTEWQINFPGGSTIQVVSADAVNNNRGLRRDVVIVDEADDVDISAFESVLGPWFTEPVSLRQILVTGTPRRGRYGLLWRAFRVWPYGDADRAPLPNAYSFHATGYDCPAVVSREWLESERRAISPDRFSREYLCDFDSGEGLVYPFFDASFHVRVPPRLALFHSYIVGVDYGFNDPSVFVVIGIAGAGKDTVCHVLREWYLTGKSATELAATAREINQSFPNAHWYADHDPTNTKTIKDEAHVNIREADKGKVEDGVSFVADAIFIREDDDGRRWANLYVDPSCRHTIEEFGLYRRKRDPRNTDRVLDDIDTSKNDHCFVAGTLVATQRGDVPIESVVPGDMVLTRVGLQPVRACGMTSPSSPTRTLLCSDGTEITATPNHLFWTEENGWTPLDSLRYGLTLRSCWSSASCSSASRTDATQSPGDSNSAATTAPVASEGFTAPSGSTITAPSRMGTMSTTRTRKPSTTTSQTLSAYRLETTGVCTGMTRRGRGSLRGPTPSGRSLQPGIPQLRAELGTVNTEWKPGKNENPGQGTAIAVALDSTPSLGETATDFAATSASRPRAEHRASTTKTVSVPRAGEPTASTDTLEQRRVHVVAVRPGHDRAAVYDLTVDGEPEFFANGVLVHNCMDAIRYALVSHFAGPSRKVWIG